MNFNFRLSLSEHAVQNQRVEVVFGQTWAPEAIHQMDDRSIPRGPNLYLWCVFSLMIQYQGLHVSAILCRKILR
jgi:hypothetical protein